MSYQEVLHYINIVAQAHQEHPNKFGKTIRRMPSGGENPYFIHPVWCAMMILMEPKLSDNVRLPGCLALLFHDFVEDTNQKIPSGLSKEVRDLIKLLTVKKIARYHYSSWEKEKETILSKSPLIQLLKLYDKTATLYDLALPESRYEQWIEFIEKLTINVEREYGSLNIVLLARALSIDKSRLKIEKR